MNTLQGRKQGPTAVSNEWSGTGDDDGECGEMDVSADVGSTGSNDRLTEDYDRDEGTVTTGFFGKASDVAWIQRARREVLTESEGELSRGSSPEQGMSIPKHGKGKAHAVNNHIPGVGGVLRSEKGELKNRPSTYHLDDHELNLPDQVNEYELPPRPIADAFIDAYFSNIHATFPILAKSEFIESYEKIYEAYSQPISRRGRAMLNLVFALGAKYSVLTRAHWCDELDHLVYFSRARVLSLDRGALWEVGDIEQVQVLGLGVLYLIASNHTNR